MRTVFNRAIVINQHDNIIRFDVKSRSKNDTRCFIRYYQPKYACSNSAVTGHDAADQLSLLLNNQTKYFHNIFVDLSISCLNSLCKGRSSPRFASSALSARQGVMAV